MKKKSLLIIFMLTAIINLGIVSAEEVEGNGFVYIKDGNNVKITGSGYIQPTQEEIDRANAEMQKNGNDIVISTVQEKTDTAVTSNPNTGDNIYLYITVGLSLIFLMCMINHTYKKIN